MQDEPIQIQGGEQATGQPAGPPPIDPMRQKLSLGLIAIGSVMIMVIVFRMLWRGQRRRAGAGAEPAPPRTYTPPAPTNSQERLERLMADAEELTRRLAAHLDNKAAKLETLLERTEARLAELDAALERAPETTTRQAPPPPAPPPRLAEPAREAVDPVHRRVYDLADQGLTPVDIARRIDRPTGQVELILALRRA